MHRDDRGNKRGRWVLGVLAAGVAAILAQSAWGQATRPASRPAPPALSPAEVLKFAPKDTVAIAHVDTVAVAEFSARWIKSLAPIIENPDTAHFLMGLSAAATVADPIQAVDVYVVMPPATTVESQPRPPIPTVAIAFRTGLSVEELVDVAVKQMPPLAEMATKLKKGQDGRYTIPDGPPVVVIDGKREKTVGEGTILLVIGENAESLIDSLGTGRGAALAALLKSVDTSAPIWAAGILPANLPPDAPASITAGIHTDGGKPSIVTIVMKNAEQAGKIEMEFKKESNPFGALFDVKRADATVTFTVALDDKFIARVMEALERARTLAKQSMSGANLNGIGKGIAMYQSEHKDQSPPNLETLVEGNLISAKMLVSPMTGRTLKTDAKGVPTEAGDYVYIVLPADAPGDLVRAYEPPEINKGKGGNVLFGDFTVKWLDAEKLQAAVKKTQEALQQKKN